MRIYVTNVFVDDQNKALDFYTNQLGFAVKQDIPLGEHRWLTVVDKNDGVQLLLEPSEHPAVGPFKRALMADGIPTASFMVDDLEAEFTRLQAGGVVFVQPPTPAGPVSMAVLDDTCGNLIQLIQMNEPQPVGS